ncbi:PhzF family phenazine biosynthesis protein [Actinomadura sp. 9N407]|uniref:PhzF family phenazine biosynthesis protein n=1 Tax=Actinomadura sp. 9N407 TaxID=3375154 RepID=UPI0037B026B5
MRMFVVDAFTDRPFTGNPASVCLLDAPADPSWMQLVAAEMRHSETAFVRPVDEADADFELRWFTPTVEIGLCGHATLASGHALYESGIVPAGRPIRFRTMRSGILTVRPGNGGAAGRLDMDFPACPAEPVAVPDGLAEALGAPFAWVGRNDQPDLLVELSDEDAVRKLVPDHRALGAFGVRCVIVTAPADPGSPYDFVSRVFGPGAGVDEDPVTGSAHCALAPYWTGKLGRDTLTGYQASERGGEVGTTTRGGRVVLSGTAVTVLDGGWTA